VDPALAAGDGVPDDELHGSVVVHEGAAVAAVEHVAGAVVVGGRAERRGGDEAAEAAVLRVAEEAEREGRPVEGAVAAEEGRVGERAEPGLADGGGADEARGVGRREAEEDLVEGVGDFFSF
jgi:hypothetical protein